MNQLEHLLDAFVGETHVTGIIITGRDGIPIAQSRSISQDDALAPAAYCAEIIYAAERMSAENGKSALIGAIIERSDELIDIQPLGEYAALIARMRSAAPLVAYREMVLARRQQMLSALDEMMRA